jgi:hypothetical protein
MALTLNDFVGFETGGLEEATATAGTPVVLERGVMRLSITVRLMNTELIHLLMYLMPETIKLSASLFILLTLLQQETLIS